MARTSQMKAFLFYFSFLEVIDGLPDADQLLLYKAITHMHFYGKIPKLTGIPKRLFASIKPQIESNKRRYENGAKGKEYGVKGKEYGVLGGRPRKNKIPSDSEEGGSVNNPPYKEKGKENIKDKDKDKTNKENIKNKTEKVNEKDGDARVCVSAAQEKCKETMDFEAVFEDYNNICTSLPAVKCLTDARRAAISARIDEHGSEKLHEVFLKAEKSDFLCGRNRMGKGGCPQQAESTWRASFDWLLNKANFVKVLEGNYDRKPVFDSDQTDLSDIFPSKSRGDL